MTKVYFDNPIVELQGDEMAQVMWEIIKRELIEPFFSGPIITFDLSIQNRDKTEDRVTVEAAEAIKTHRVGVKCATITPDEARVEEFGLKKMWPSPNGTIRNYLNGTVFREPIIIEKVPRLIPHWREPIVVARHAYGDQYRPYELRIKAGSEVWVQSDQKKELAFKFETDGVFLGIHNLDRSIEGFARSVFNYGLLRRLNVFFSTKNTILKTYDGCFKEIFQEVFENEFRTRYESEGLSYEHKLIDDMVARALKSHGGFVWALKNYDGDVQSDLVAQGFGSLGLMTSVLLSPDGSVVETEAAHGTVTQHYRRWQKGEPVSTNPIASIFAWTQGLQYRGRFDQNEKLVALAAELESTVKKVVNGGVYTKDLCVLIEGEGSKNFVTTEEFIAKVKEEFMRKI